MKRLADDLDILDGFPPFAINIYVIGGVLVDCGTRFATGRILRQVRGRTLTAVALTHVHADHQGACHEVCTTLGLPLWCGARDADAMETEGLMLQRMPKSWLREKISKQWQGPPHPVSRQLREGDEVGGFQVLETPGHTTGHVAFWREADRTLIMGDVLTNMHIGTGFPGLYEPLAIFTIDPAQNRDSARRLAALEPRLVCFGHGKPLRDPAKLSEFVGHFPEGNRLS
jgi:glyoxylase-like metal-dependent hydrolase (beta-lactamase superfamily II)